jgi:hypothetical protein
MKAGGVENGIGALNNLLWGSGTVVPLASSPTTISLLAAPAKVRDHETDLTNSIDLNGRLPGWGDRPGG